MTTKNQITLPKKIVDTLGLHKGSLFNVRVSRNHIELVPLEVRERSFSEEDFKKLDVLVTGEKKKGAKRVTADFIKNIKN
jgi:AbrB family looped-hinge helix DNA binding protein